MILHKVYFIGYYLPTSVSFSSEINAIIAILVNSTS